MCVSNVANIRYLCHTHKSMNTHACNRVLAKHITHVTNTRFVDTAALTAGFWWYCIRLGQKLFHFEGFWSHFVFCYMMAGAMEDKSSIACPLPFKTRQKTFIGGHIVRECVCYPRVLLLSPFPGVLLITLSVSCAGPFVGTHRHTI